MMNTKKLIKMVKKWQQRANLSREIISFHRSTTSSSTFVKKGCFVVYMTDKVRYAFLLCYMSSSIFQELFNISEEEFGLPTGGKFYHSIQLAWNI
ncbi:hypothetical protein Bca4012_076829 [Brassica carinata]|uniref:Auxin-responsive protein n=3 Tax=Brassica TaxID=3705 RepID=A0A8S9GZB7_BRACR|nr:PREDICTED: auxin-responsive protein SAUR68-like [Brassica oleracea var. oleracea]XP_013670209.1 auxin-responsive protein SAUR68-like [Brassica napus]KAF2551685.1 hypothetical protein F2Q68_00035018 [Brassica cretica]KAF3592524.1 hypothetical protein DY000_02023169 [Brassica cretica]KAG2265825.1 hypothetical protein Bca52824_072904 [Brassica carinata]